MAIITSAALRQARGIVTEESVAGSDAGDGLFGEGRSSAGFSRGWFDSGTATPQEADPQEYQGKHVHADGQGYGAAETVPICRPQPS